MTTKAQFSLLEKGEQILELDIPETLKFYLLAAIADEWKVAGKPRKKSRE